MNRFFQVVSRGILYLCLCVVVSCGEYLPEDDLSQLEESVKANISQNSYSTRADNTTVLMSDEFSSTTINSTLWQTWDTANVAVTTDAIDETSAPYSVSIDSNGYLESKTFDLSEYYYAYLTICLQNEELPSGAPNNSYLFISFYSENEEWLHRFSLTYNFSLSTRFVCFDLGLGDGYYHENFKFKIGHYRSTTTNLKFFVDDVKLTAGNISCTLEKPVLETVNNVSCDNYGFLFKWSTSEILQYDLILNGEKILEDYRNKYKSYTSGLKLEATNSWQVVAKDCNGNEMYSNVGSFNASPSVAPVAPTVLESEDFNCDGGNTTLTWQGGTAEYYTVVLNDVVVADNLTSESYVVSNEIELLPNNTWYVIANACAGVQDVSEPQSFAAYSNYQPVQPALVSPENDETAYCDLTFDWEANGNGFGINYDLLIYDINDLINPVRTLSTKSTLRALDGEEKLPNGTYRWRVRASNCAGEEVLSAQRQFVVNNTPPAPVLVWPSLDDGWMQDMITFEWSITDAESDVVFDLYIDGALVAENVVTTTYALTEAQKLQHGAHSWYVVAKGCAGESTSSGSVFEFKVDTEPPSEFELLEPDEGKWYNKVTLKWEESVENTADGVGMDVCSVYLDGEKIKELLATETEYFLDTENVILIDEEFPSTTLNTSYWKSSTGSISSFAISEPSSPYSMSLSGDEDKLISKAFDISSARRVVLSYWYEMEGYNEAPEEPLFVYYYNGVKSQTLISHSIETSSSTKFLHQQIDIPEDGLVHDFMFSFNNIERDGTNYDYWFIDNVRLTKYGRDLSEGSHEWFVVCIDRYGNSRESQSRNTFLYDGTIPTRAVPKTPGNESATQNLRPTFTWYAASDAKSGLAGYRVFIDNEEVSGGDLLPADTLSWTPDFDLAEGVRTWTIVAEDNAGNISTSIAYSVTVDSTSPEAPESMQPSGYTTSGKYCWLDAVDTGSGICNYEVWLDGNQEYSDIAAEDLRRDENGCVDFFNWPQEGYHNWYLVISDCAGNQITTDSVEFLIDTLPPEVFSATKPVDEANVNNNQPEYCWNLTTDQASGVDHYELYIDDMDEVVLNIVEDSTKSTVKCVTPDYQLSPGIHQWKVVAVDKVTHSRTATDMPYSFTVYEYSPVIVAPLEGSYLNDNTPTITWQKFQGNEGVISHYIISIDGGDDIVVAADSDSYNVMGGLADGSHTVRVSAEDFSGYTSSVNSRQFFIDTVAPTFTLGDNISDGSCIGTILPDFYWTEVSDAGSGVKSIELVINSNTVAIETDTSAGSIKPDSELAEGEYHWWFKVSDNAGNEFITNHSAFYVDLTYATADVLGLSEGAEGDTFIVTGIAEDSGACGVMSVVIKLGTDTVTYAESEDGFANWTAEVPKPENGLHHILVNAIDGAGNISPSNSYEFIIDPCSVLGNCNEETGICYIPREDGINCNDNSLCTSNDSCSEGYCVGGEAVTCTASDQCHGVGVCIPATGECTDPILENGTLCNADDNGCTIDDQCVEGVCTSGGFADCSSENDACNTGACQSTDSESYTCIKNPVPNEGQACNADDNGCTYNDACSSGSCVAGEQVDCSDEDDACNLGVCRSKGSNLYACIKDATPKEGIRCNADSNGCTGGDSCVSGRCASGNKVDCSSADDQCNTGVCVSTGDESYTCTKDPSTKEGQICNADYTGCTVDDSCKSGSCVAGTPADCSASDNQCTTGMCRSSGVNSFICENDYSVHDNKTCDDEDVCTVDDVCQSGQCLGTELGCADEFGCTTDSCNNENGECDHTPDDQFCDDQNDCTAEACSAENGCEYENVEDWTTCNNNESMACFSGECLDLDEGDTCESYTLLKLNQIKQVNMRDFHSYKNDFTNCEQAAAIKGNDIFFRFDYEAGTLYSVKVHSETIDPAIILWSDCVKSTQCLAAKTEQTSEDDSLGQLRFDESGYFIIQVVDVSTQTEDVDKDMIIVVTEVNDEKTDGDNDVDEDVTEVSEDGDHNTDGDLSEDGDVDTNIPNPFGTEGCHSSGSENLSLVFGLLVLLMLVNRRRQIKMNSK